MSNDIRNLRDTIIPKSDQLNSEQLLSGPMTIKVTEVKRGSGDDQPIIVHYEGDNGRPFKPCKSMRKVLIFAWGDDGNEWAGKMATLFNKRDVKWGGVEVGGIRISHLSHIKGDISLSLTATRGKKEAFVIKKLDANDPTQAARLRLESAAREGMDALKKAWGETSDADKRSIGGSAGCPAEYKATAEKADAAKAEPPKPEPASVAAILNTPEPAAPPPTDGPLF